MLGQQMSSKVQHIIGTGDSLLRVADLKWAEPTDFKAGRSVILVHVFTSHGYYLRELGNFIMTFGYQVFIFNYNSYRGIARASESLKDFLLRYDRNAEGGISANPVSIIAHSMGGLVARHLGVDADAKRMVRGIAMLGVPNNGCFPSARWLSCFIQYGEHLSGFMPGAGNPACLSAMECIKADVTGVRPFIDTLNDTWEKSASCPPSVSVSGGKRFLTLSRNKLKNWLTNQMIQAEIGDEDNDGLVTEKSVNMQDRKSVNASHRYVHFNSYPYYRDLNHTNLTQNQTLALEIVEWLRKF